MNTTEVMIDLDDGTHVPMTPPPVFGPGFAAIIAEALSWGPERREAASAAHNDVVERTDGYDAATDRIMEALRAAEVGIWSCQFGDPDAVPEAGPYIETLADKVTYGASEVAAAVLARDLRLVTEADFNTVTGWWVAAGLPMTGAVLWATNADQVARHAAELERDATRVPGWPIDAVATYGMTVLDGRYGGLPGLNWYRKTRQVAGADLAVGDWIDTDDRHGARAIRSIPAEQPAAGARTVLIGGGEPVTVQLDQMYRVVEPHTLVDIDVEQVYVFVGGPVDGQVGYWPIRENGNRHCRTTDGIATDAMWGPADAWPATTERYAPAAEQPEVVATVLEWRLPTHGELDAAGRERQRSTDEAALDAALGADDQNSRGN